MAVCQVQLSSLILQRKEKSTDRSKRQAAYRKICLKGFFAGLIFGGAYFRRGLLLEGILRFKMGLVCQKKNSDSNSPWVYIREGLL